MHSNRTYLNYKYLKIVITATTLILLLTLPPLTHTTATTEPQVEWEKTFGGAGDDWGYSVQQTSDGGYIIVGRTTSYGAGSSDVYLIKVDANGNIRWNKTFGGGGSDWGYSVQQTSDGGYIIVGETTSYGAGSSDVYLIKVDANGNIQWGRTLGGQRDDRGFSVQQTSDGGYIIVGETTSYGAGGRDVYLIKVDANGNMQWSKTFGGARDDWGFSVQQTSDGGYIIVGETTSYGAGGRDVYLIKVDANGNMQWIRTLGGQRDDRGFSVQQTSDGGYIIVGETTSYGAGGRDVYLIKVDANGNMQWIRTLGGAGDDWGFSVQQTSDGGYIIVGETTSYGAGGRDVYLIKVDANGNMQWSKTFGGAGDDWGFSVQQTSDGGYIIVGTTRSYGAGGRDVYLIKLGLRTIPTTPTPVTTPAQTPTQPPTTEVATSAVPIVMSFLIILLLILGLTLALGTSESSRSREPETLPTSRSTSRPPRKPKKPETLPTSGPREPETLPTSGPREPETLPTSGPREPETLPTSGPREPETLPTSGPREPRLCLESPRSPRLCLLLGPESPRLCLLLGPESPRLCLLLGLLLGPPESPRSPRLCLLRLLVLGFNR